MRSGKQPILILDQDCRYSVIKVTDQLNAIVQGFFCKFDQVLPLKEKRTSYFEP